MEAADVHHHSNFDCQLVYTNWFFSLVPLKFCQTHVHIRICFPLAGRLGFELPLTKCLSCPPLTLILRQQELGELASLQASNEVITLEYELLMMGFFGSR